MKVSLKNIIVPSIPLAVVLVVDCIALWMSAFVGTRLATVSTQSTLAVETLQTVFIPNSLLAYFISLGFTLFNAYLLAQLNNRYTIIRIRTFLPILTFLILMGTWNETHLSNGSHLALTLFILALFFFFNMFRNRKGSEQAFMGSFLISVSSIIINPLIFIIPVCWIGFIMFQSFSIRTLLASIFGILTPWILFLTVYYFINPSPNLLDYFNINYNPEFNPLSISLPNIIYATALIIIFIINLIGMYSNSHSDAIHTRTKLNFLLLLLTAITIISYIFINQYASFLPLIALLFSFLVSHSFTLKQNNFYSIVFIVFCMLNIAYVISKYIQF